MRIRYNAPITLTFAILCIAVFLIISHVPGSIYYFTAPSRLEVDPYSPIFYLRCFSYVFGHESFSHLLGNLTFLLLLGPILEEKYHSFRLLVMMLITVIITSLFNIIFMTTQIIGSSGLVFMMILLVSFTNFKKGELPLTFVAIAGLFLFQQIYDGLFIKDNISELGHIIGGLVGSLLGFVFQHKKEQEKARLKEKKQFN